MQEVSLAHPTCTNTIIKTALELDRLSPSNSTRSQRVANDIPTGMAKDVRPTKVDELVRDESVDPQEISEVHHPLHITCRGLYNPAAHRRLLNVCRDCYNLFREAEVFSMCTSFTPSLFYLFTLLHFYFFTISLFHTFTHSLSHTFNFQNFTLKVFSMCTANCFDSPFFLTCAKALLMEIDTVVKDTMTVG